MQYFNRIFVFVIGVKQMIERMNSRLRSAPVSGIRRFTALAKAQPDCAMLTIGEPDFDTPDAIKAAAVRALENGRTHYPMNAGDPDLRSAIAAFEAESRSLDYAPDEIIVTAGASEAIYVAMTGVLEPGDEVIIPTPAFALYETIAHLAGAKAVHLDTSDTGFQPDAGRLEALFTDRTKLVVLNSPNNPTGVAYSRETLDAIMRALRKREIFVLCDDVYIGLAEKDCPFFAGYRKLRDRILAVQSFSKPYAMTGWRMGYLMADRPVIKALMPLHQSAVVSVPAFLQDGCIQALKTDCSAMAETYRARRDVICARLSEMGLPHARPEGAFYVFPDISRFGMSSEEFCIRMIQEGRVAGVPGSVFGAEGYVRFSFCYSTEEINRAMDRLEDFIHMLEKEI